MSIALLTGAIDGLMHYNTGGAQAAGAGAVILIVMQVIKLTSTCVPYYEIDSYFSTCSFSGSFSLAVQKIRLCINSFIRDLYCLYHKMV